MSDRVFELELQIDALQTMLKHPGWEIFAHEQSKQADALLTAMHAAKTSDELVRATVAYMTVKDVARKPEVMLSVLRDRLHSLTNRK